MLSWDNDLRSAQHARSSGMALFAPFGDLSQHTERLRSATFGKSSGVAFRSRKTMFGLGRTTKNCSDRRSEGRQKGQDMAAKKKDAMPLCPPPRDVSHGEFLGQTQAIMSAERG